MSNDLVVSQCASLAKSLSIATTSPGELVAVLKATAFKGQVTDAQLTALLVVASQYGLNPWTKEIYAFPDKNNGIVPVVGVDGWSRIINSHQAFDGMEFAEDPEWCECIIFRKDRAHPIKVREYMAECKRPGMGPWSSHPKRMLRHKAMIQCARLAFGFVGIYDPDEAERVIEGEARDVTPRRSAAMAVAQATPADSPERDEATTRCRAEAAKGTEHFREFWKAYPPACRALVMDRMADFKATAESADTMIADAEAE